MKTTENIPAQTKPIKGYEGLYTISSDGIVTSVERVQVNNSRRVYKSVNKSYMINPRGYLRVSLMKESKNKVFFVHRLVAESFIPNPYNKPFVNHINFIRNDNRVENLEWVTAKENINHSRANDRFKDSVYPKRAEHTIVKCYYCGKDTTTMPSIAKKQNVFYCSSECRNLQPKYSNNKPIRNMKDLIKLSNYQVNTSKSVHSLTPFELSQIDNYQTRNRGFRDEDDVKDWNEEMEDLNHQDWFLD